MSWTIVEQSETGNTKYVITEFKNLENGLDTTVNALRPSIDAPGVSNLGNAITVTGISATTTSGSGTGAVFTLISSAVGIISALPTGTITVTVPGSGYVATDVITFSQADLINAGFVAPSADLNITLVGGDIIQTIASTPNLNIAGYTRGTVIAVTTGGSLEVLGSNDGINFFQLDFINPNPVTSFGPTAKPIIWNYALRNIRFITSVASFSSIYLMGIAGGGNDVLDITHNVAGAAAEPLSSLQYNDSSNWGGTGAGVSPADTLGVRYDKLANANTGQLQLDNGSAALPILSFVDSGGNYTNGIYREAIDIVGMSALGNPIAVVANATTTGYSVGFNVVNRSAANLGLIRIATTTGGTPGDASWEDGFFGNSEEMFFMCNDFSFVNSAGTAAVTCGVASGRGPVLVLPAGLVPAGRITACKLVPKGFAIPSGDTSLLTIQIIGFGVANTLYGSGVFPIGFCTAEVFSYNITTPTVAPVSCSAITTLTSWTTSGINDDTIITTAIEGDGNTVVFLSITIPANAPSNANIALERGLSFASLQLVRLPT